MNELLIISAIVVIVAAVTAGVLRSAENERRRVEYEAARQAEYQRWRAEFLANASPIEAQAFLIREQTDAIVQAQRQAAAILGMISVVNGPHGPWQSR